MAAKRIHLKDDQKEQILQLFEEKPDLNYIVQTVFNNPDIDGRSKEGRAVREFLTKQGKEYKTTFCTKEKFIDLTVAQKQFLQSDQVSPSMSAIEIARLCFKDETIKPLSAQHRAIQDYLHKFRPDVLDPTQALADGQWHSPKSHVTVIRKINKWCGTTLNEDINQVPLKYKKCVEKSLTYLQIHKLGAEINSYKTEADRLLYESEFIRAVWDKPDLTADELNLYMMICGNYVRKRHIQLRLDAFNNMLEAQDMEDQEISMKLSEYIKVTSQEFNDCEKRIESMIQKLNGDRAKRIKEAGALNNTILSLVEEWQQAESRARMLQLAEMHNKLEEEEANRLETIDEFKCRILGVDIEELI